MQSGKVVLRAPVTIASDVTSAAARHPDPFDVKHAVASTENYADTAARSLPLESRITRKLLISGKRDFGRREGGIVQREIAKGTAVDE